MKRSSILTIFLLIILNAGYTIISGQAVPSSKTMESMLLVNKYFMDKWPDVGQTINPVKEYPGNFWTRGVYFEGLLALHKLNPAPEYLKYALDWGEFHKWGLHDGINTISSEYLACGQSYIDLYMLDRYKEVRIKEIRACMEKSLAAEKPGSLDNTDELQMVMPIYARLGKIYNNEKYFDRMHEIYLYAKQSYGTTGLYSQEDHLWFHDKDFMPPFKEPNGNNCYWSRGNGWVVASLVRTIDFLPNNSKYRKDYSGTLVEMFEALVPLQREDGFWNVSLMDPTNFGGKELTGTALFVYGMAWAINADIISRKIYLPVVNKAWNAIITEALHTNGSLGYVQGPGKEPKDSQPVGFDIMTENEDLGTGCFLLAGTEMYILNKSMEPKIKEPKKEKADKDTKAGKVKK